MKRVIIIGAGPAGLFAAGALGKDFEVYIFEEGKPIEERTNHVLFNTECECNICDILKGQGGSGGFSDGKLTMTLERGAEKGIFKEEAEEELLKLGKLINKFSPPNKYKTIYPVKIPERYLKNPRLKFESYPLIYLGTDGIQKLIQNYCENNSLNIYYNCKVVDITENKVSFKKDSGLGTWKADYVIIASGGVNSENIKENLKSLNIQTEDTFMDLGIRIEMPRKELKELQDEFYDFKVSYTTDEGLTLRSFCINDGGIVVNEKYDDFVAVNGRSNFKEKTSFSNLAIMARLTKKQFQSGPKWLGRSIVKRLNMAGLPIYQSLQAFLYEDYQYSTNYKTNFKAFPGNISNILPGFLKSAFRKYLKELKKVAPKIINTNAIVYAPELKYFGEEILVDLDWKIKGTNTLYAVGHATGKVSSFISCAVSGMLAAESIKKENNKT